MLTTLLLSLLAQPLWQAAEAPTLTDHVQLTSRAQFVRAGEAYFSPDGQWIIFQAVPVPVEGAEADPFYAMYVARLARNARGTVVGLETPERISPPGSANTCGWFHPTHHHRVMFGSTLVTPSQNQKAGFQVGTRKYTWMFPQEMDIVYRDVESIRASPSYDPFRVGHRDCFRVPGQADPAAARPIFTLPNYDAECSYSPDGRYILYAHVEDQKENSRPDANIYIYDTAFKQTYPIITAPGYDGGPFFSPDGLSICYRSDRKGDDLLQLFVADLRFNAGGVPIGLEREYQLTDNQAVNWAPFWHPSGDYLIYGTSEIGHHNYELFTVGADMNALRAGAKPGAAQRRRITDAAGADILPSFSPDGRYLMWTAQRGPKLETEPKPSSQLWIARWRE